jgi:menaquinone-dependent protoporphyrinogen oxidase
MSDRVLVAYASKSGTTEEVARTIGAELTARGHAVEVRRVEEVGDARGYDAVVLGSAVRFGKWLSPASKFVEAHRAELAEVPTSFFTVHGLATDDTEASRQKRETYVAPIRVAVKPRREAFFGGRIDYARLGFAERVIAKMVKAPEQDQRDWPAIRAWAEQIHRDLAGEAA